MKTTRPPTPRTREIISRQLRSIIHDSGLTAYSLGREAGVDPGQIQRFLNEERDIKLDTLDRLAEPLGLRLVETARGRSHAKLGRVGTSRDPRRAARPEPPARVEDLTADVDPAGEDEG